MKNRLKLLSVVLALVSTVGLRPIPAFAVSLTASGLSLKTQTSNPHPYRNYGGTAPVLKKDVVYIRTYKSNVKRGTATISAKGEGVFKNPRADSPKI